MIRSRPIVPATNLRSVVALLLTLAFTLALAGCPPKQPAPTPDEKTPATAKSVDDTPPPPT